MIDAALHGSLPARILVDVALVTVLGVMGWEAVTTYDNAQRITRVEVLAAECGRLLGVPVPLPAGRPPSPATRK